MKKVRLGWKLKRAEAKKLKLSSGQGVMFTLCDCSDKNVLCGPNSKNPGRIECSIDCFNIYNPGIARAIEDPNSPEATLRR